MLPLLSSDMICAPSSMDEHALVNSVTAWNMYVAVLPRIAQVLDELHWAQKDVRNSLLFGP